MDKGLDFRRYDELEYRTSHLGRKHVLHSRILNLSSTKGPTAYHRIGLALTKLGQSEKSLAQFKRATIIHPHNARAHVDLIKALLHLKREKEAFSSMHRGFCISHDNYYLHRFIITTFEKQGRVEDLESFYQETESMMTDKKLIPGLFYQCAQVLVSLNQYSQALISYKKAIETSPVEGPRYLYHYHYAVALYHEGLFEEALVQFEHAWRLNPGKNLTKNNIAFLHYCLGRAEKALEEFEYIIQNGLELCVTYSNLLLIQYHLDKDEETINKAKDLLQPHIQPNRPMLIRIYEEELTQTELRLQSEIGEKAREFETKKLQGINMVLSFINQEEEN